MDSTGLNAQERGFEEGLGTSEPLIANGDDTTIRKLIGFFKFWEISGYFLFIVKGNVTDLLLDISDCVSIFSIVNGKSCLIKNFVQVFCEVTTSKAKFDYVMGNGIS